jgi:hypothetical protein
MHEYNFLGLNETNVNIEDPVSLRYRIKIALFREFLSKAKAEDWFIWQDADTMYTNFTQKWENILDGRFDLIIGEAPDVIANNGVFALKVSDWSRSFLDSWDNDMTAMGARWLDNGPMVHSILRSFYEGRGEYYYNTCRYVLNIGLFNLFDIFRYVRKESSLTECFIKQVKELAKRTHVSIQGGETVDLSNNSYLSDLSSFRQGDERVQGYFLLGDPHILGVWGINSGISFASPNDWKNGNFIVHFAGQPSHVRLANAKLFGEKFSVGSRG